MKINNLASSFLHVKTSRDEEKRVIDYDLKNRLLALEKDTSSTEGKLKVLAMKDQIKVSKLALEEREVELKEVSLELLEELKRADIKPGERLDTHVQDQIYFSVWYDEDNKVYTAGTFHKL